MDTENDVEIVYEFVKGKDGIFCELIDLTKDEEPASLEQMCDQADKIFQSVNEDDKPAYFYGIDTCNQLGRIGPLRCEDVHQLLEFYEKSDPYDGFWAAVVRKGSPEEHYLTLEEVRKLASENANPPDELVSDSFDSDSEYEAIDYATKPESEKPCYIYSVYGQNQLDCIHPTKCEKLEDILNKYSWYGNSNSYWFSAWVINPGSIELESLNMPELYKQYLQEE